MPSTNSVKEFPNTKSKNNISAHLLLFLFGWLGAQRLYINERTSGVLMLFAYLGVAGFVVLYFLWVLDIFTFHQ
jgi:TM2 domain-containing membrane protein YozV